jgi:Arc/MetJ family transcription regulator
MRTNVDLNDELVDEAMRLSGARSKREVIDLALRSLIESRAAEERRRGWRERAARLDAKLARLRLRKSPAALLRDDRDRR